MNTDGLGSRYELRDQGESMLHAAFAWAGYLILITVADFMSKDSLFSALVRLVSMVFMMLAVLATYGSIPRSMRLAKSLIVVLAFGGIFFQIVAVTDLHDVQP